jgi:hypothetical protein
MERFRELMEEQWRAFQARASASGEGGNMVNVLGEAWYRSLDSTERSMANHVLRDWVTHGTFGQQSSALALIREFRIRPAEPALHQLQSKLDGTPSPAAKDLREKVQSVIDALKTDGD